MGPPSKTLRLGYNTNGFAHHRLPDALRAIAEIGYRSVAITLDVHHLDPFSPGHVVEREEIAAICRDLDLMPVIETGARFLLDPRRKHKPTLLSADPDERQARVDFLFRAIAVATGVSGPPWAPIVSLWSGTADEGDPASRDELDARLAAGLRTVCERAASRGVTIAFEPEPGMHIDDMPSFARIAPMVESPALALTLDVGHAHLTEADGAAATIRAWAGRIANVHLEGMARGKHDHLAPWEGDLDVRGALATLRETGYAGPVTFELSRHSHDAVRIARRAFEFVNAP